MDLSKLNQQQIKAVEFPLSPVMVMAGAGTGKTTVLTNRISYLIEKLGLSPDRILAITFTNKAANEMNERVKKLIGQELNWIGTFHGICIRILRREIYHLNRKSNFKIIDQEDATTIIKDIYQEESFYDADLSYKNMLNNIDKIKRYELDVEDIINPENYSLFSIDNDKQANMITKVFLKYTTKLDALNYLDFNDILFFTDLILREYQSAREYWQKRFDYLLVDEFQDTSNIEYRLLKILGGVDHNIFAVGDEDQTIYTFRGANPKIIHQFINEFEPKVPVIFLEENYRSTQQILDAANKLISHNEERYKKDLKTFNPDGPKPSLFVAENEEQEANWVANKIKMLLTQEGVQEKDIAVLYRNNYLSRPFEQALVFESIKYTIYGSIRFYQRLEIKDMIAYLNAVENNDEISLRRIINTPRRKISEETIRKVLEYAFNENIEFAEALNNVNDIKTLSSTQINSIQGFNQLMSEFKSAAESKNLVELFDLILLKTNYLEYSKQRDAKRYLDIKQNLDELRVAMLEYLQKNTGQENLLSNYLQEISLFTSSSDKKREENSVSLMTVHTAKGLEFKYVFLVGFVQNIFPSAKSLDNLDEERRIAYVALTRAKLALFITANNGYNYSLQAKKDESVFLKEIGLNTYVRLSPIYKKRSNLDLYWYDSNKPKIDVKKQYLSETTNTYKVGDIIIHSAFGSGTIIGIYGDELEISFKPPYKIKRILFNHKAIKRLVS